MACAWSSTRTIIDPRTSTSKGRTAKQYLFCTARGPPELRESYGFGRPELGRIKDALAAVLADLCEEWSQIHGHY
jgi:hypothetical protein